jgi:hypothetical protein
MNYLSNPWSFFPVSVVSTPIIAGTGLVLQPNGTVILTTISAHDLVSGNFVTVAAPDNLAYQGYYQVQSITSPTIAVIMPFAFTPPSSTAASGNGNVALNQYSSDIRVKNISWQVPEVQGQVLTIVDRNGNPVWDTVAAGPGISQDTGELYTVSGITIVEMDSGLVLLTRRLP